MENNAKIEGFRSTQRKFLWPVWLDVTKPKGYIASYMNLCTVSRELTGPHFGDDRIHTTGSLGNLFPSSEVAV